MTTRDKFTQSEVTETARENMNEISKETTVVNNTDGSRSASITDIPSHGVTVVHDHNNGHTYVEDRNT